METKEDKREGKQTSGGLRAGTVSMAVGFFVWYTCSNWVSALTYDASFSYWWLNKSGAVVLVTLVACAILWRVPVPARVARSLDWAFAGVYACSFVVLLGGAGMAEPFGDLFGLLLFAAAQTWMVVRWGSCYARSSTDDVARALLLAIALVATVKCVTTFLPEAATMALMLALPFLSMGMLAVRLRDEADERPAEQWFTRASLPSFGRIVAAMAVFFFIWSILNMTLKHGTGHYSFGMAATPLYTLLSQAILFVFCAFVYWWVFRLRRHLDITVVWRFTYVLMAVALFMLVAFGMAQFIQAFTGAAVVVAKMFLWLGLANVAHHGPFKPFMVFCPGMLLYSFPDWLGRSIVSGARDVRPRHCLVHARGDRGDGGVLPAVALA